jgi:hypothetical protein
LVTLRAKQALSIDRLVHHITLDLLKRVRYRQGGYGAVMTLEGFDHRADDSGVSERAGIIVNEHPVGRTIDQALVT